MEGVMKASQILRKAKEILKSKDEEFLCIAVSMVVDYELGMPDMEIRSRIEDVLEFERYDCNNLSSRYHCIYAEKFGGYPMPAPASYLLFARLKLADFLIEQYELEGN
jgi:hypothetical protein